MGCLNLVSISVVITTYNRKYEVVRAIKSALIQRVHKEIIVVDDASSDGTYNHLLNEFGENLPFVYIRNKENKGVAYSRNTAYMKAIGDYIAYLDSDDTWNNEWLAQVAAVIDKDNSIDILLGGKYQHIKWSTQEKNYRSNIPAELIKEIVYDGTFSVSSSIFSKKLLENMKGFKTCYGSQCGREFVIRSFVNNKNINIRNIDYIAAECWEMYDGLSSAYEKYNEYSLVLFDYESCILDMVDKDFIQKYVDNKPSDKSENEWFLKLLTEADNKEKWLDMILLYKDTKLELCQQQLKRKDSFYQLMTQWITNCNNNISLASVLDKEGIKTVAIYGAGKHGRLVYKALKSNKNVEVVYFIDKKADKEEIKVYRLEQNLPQVDAVIVTPYFQFEEIKADLSKMVNTKIISLEDLVNKGKVYE